MSSPRSASAGAILTEAGLSFLGLGVPVAIPSWGGMLAEGRQYVDTRYWLALFPGAALFMTVMAINLVGDTLRDAFDPYLHVRRSPGPALMSDGGTHAKENHR